VLWKPRIVWFSKKRKTKRKERNGREGKRKDRFKLALVVRLNEKASKETFSSIWFAD